MSENAAVRAAIEAGQAAGWDQVDLDWLIEVAIEAARPVIAAETLDRAGKGSAFDGRTDVSTWLHSCAQGIRDGGWAEWLSETDHEDDPRRRPSGGHREVPETS